MYFITLWFFFRHFWFRKSHSTINYSVSVHRKQLFLTFYIYDISVTEEDICVKHAMRRRGIITKTNVMLFKTF